MSPILVVARDTSAAEPGEGSLVDAVRGWLVRASESPAAADGDSSAARTEHAAGRAASVTYARDPTRAVEAIERALTNGLADITVAPVGPTVGGPDTSPEDTLRELDEVRTRIITERGPASRARLTFIEPADDGSADVADLLEALHAADTQDPDMLRAAIERAFDGDAARFASFMATLQDGVPDATRLALRGSSVSGVSHASGEPFDARGPRSSDLDIVLLGDAAMSLWSPDAFYVPGVNSRPLDDDNRTIAPALDPARAAAQGIAGRPVSLQAMAGWFLDLRAVLQGTPYVLLDG